MKEIKFKKYKEPVNVARVWKISLIDSIISLFIFGGGIYYALNIIAKKSYIFTGAWIILLFFSLVVLNYLRESF